MKCCIKCNRVKPVEDFPINKNMKHGYLNYCYECKRIIANKSSKKNRDTMRFGGNKYKAMERDGYKCVLCGMTNAEHHKKFGYEITVDHIDGNGRYSNKQNHHIDNLQTLCSPCHGKKDSAFSSKEKVEK